MSFAERFASLPTGAKLLLILTVAILPIGIALVWLGQIPGQEQEWRQVYAPGSPQARVPRDWKEALNMPLFVPLSQTDKRALLAFLRALTDERFRHETSELAKTP